MAVKAHRSSRPVASGAQPGNRVNKEKKMGFRPKPKRYRLKFADEDYEGLEVTMRSVTVGEWTDMMAPASSDPKERAEANRQVMELFADRIVSWNLEDEHGKEVPTTVDAIMQQDRDVISTIVTSWQLMIVGVDPLAVNTGTREGGLMTSEDLDAMMKGPSSPGK